MGGGKDEAVEHKGVTRSEISPPGFHPSSPFSALSCVPVNIRNALKTVMNILYTLIT